MSNAIFCYADKFYGPRAVVTLLSSIAYDGADLFLFTDAAGVERFNFIPPTTINVIDYAKVLSHHGINATMLNSDPWLFRIPCFKYLFDEGYENVLSIDSDCLVVGEISEVWRQAQCNDFTACPDAHWHVDEKLLYAGAGGNRTNLLGCLMTAGQAGKELRTAMGINEQEAYNHLYFNCGVMAIANSPTGRHICKRFMTDVIRMRDLIARTNWRDQDYLNCLLCRMKMKGAILDQNLYNFSHAYPDKRIYHWAGYAAMKGTILPFWQPLIEQHINPALDRIDMNLAAFQVKFPLDPPPKPAA